MKPASLISLILASLLGALTACAPDFQANPLVQEIRLDKRIKNVTYSYKQIYYSIEDSTRWAEIWNTQDTIVQEGPHLKFRSDRIWYEMTESPTGYRSRQQYPGWERKIDSIDSGINIISLLNNHRVRVDIPAADVVLGGDSIRIAIIHTTGPAFDWDFREYQPQPDQLLLTTPGNDTMPIVLDMESVGPVSRQTVFRVGQHTYVLRSIGEDYGSIIIERLTNSRGLSLTAEIDLNYKQVPVKDPDGSLTHIKRTPGKELIIYFWGGFRGEKKLLKLDSLYQSIPEQQRETFDLVAISRFSSGDHIRTLIEEEGILIPLFQATSKTCLRLNCTGYLPSAVRVDSRGKIVSFHEWGPEVEQLMIRVKLPESR
ncbi:hypothetical protein FUA23_04175 [Neolewinella aurantiaca]|uniref:Uncharacterized protein n=1 Tax=Neolewinella aurantiaca TaxID=2602767 RepID=A0A5C7FZ43_9BACT|nr:hypothetical protein [Neolewinella aurantiaca]TXF91007.1 hypothetical protein FUA23_04175 [Neolewinella aurantiaca]